MASVEVNEIIDAQYHCRQLQIKKILTETTQKFFSDSKNFTDEEIALYNLLNSPRYKIEILMQSHPSEIEEIYQKAAISVRSVAEKGHVMDTLDRLVEMSKPDNRQISEVEIEYPNNTLPLVYKAAFYKHEELLASAAMHGRDNAWKTILQVMEGNVPLMRLKYDLAVKKNLPLREGINGAYVASLPTKVANVDLRYFYPKNEQTPRLSFVVLPFK